jgi:murein L,D-transpeptidase YcbB/YkuD
MRRLVIAMVGEVLLVGPACGDDDDVDSVSALEQRVADLEDEVADAQESLDDATATFCDDTKQYITAIDRYGKVFDDKATTVGDVKTAGKDLEDPREEATSSAESVVEARDDLIETQEALADAQEDLAAARAGTNASADESTTTTSSVPPLPEPATIDRVERAESDLAEASEDITDKTSLSDAGAQFNAAAVSLEVAWLRLFADAGCLTDEQQDEAVAAVTGYTAALQTSLQTAGYYDSEIDGVYGSATVNAVEALQEENDLPVTGFADRATAAALDAEVAAEGAGDATQALTQTTAVQTTLKLAGYWTGPVDGQWTPALTDALKEMQTDLAVDPTGVVDPATLHALERAIDQARSTPSTTTSITTTTTTTTK